MEKKEELKQTPHHLMTFFLILTTLFLIRTCADQVNSRSIGFSDFKKELGQGNIKAVTIMGEEIKGEFKKAVNGKQRFSTTVVVPEIATMLDQYKVPYESFGTPQSWLHIASFILPLLLFGAFWYSIIHRGIKNLSGSSGFMSIGKNKAKIYVETDTKLTFKDVAGADEALEELKEVIEFLKNAQKVKVLGGKMPKGVLLVGAPGTGKTLIAKAMAGEAGVPFFSTNGSEFVEMFVGVGAARVRDLFEQAKKSAPCIIFIDELDALGKTRQVSPLGGNDEKEQTLNQLLVEMDGFDTTGGIIILAATNRPELIDPALLRAGRFDRQVVIDRPDKKGREDILRIHVKNVKVETNLKFEEIAAMTAGFSGADLANLVNEAALIATREEASLVKLVHFTLALERIVAGLEKKNRLLTPKEKKIVAFHEMGHAIVGRAYSADEKIHKVSIIPRGMGSMGHTIQTPLEDRYIITKDEIKNKLIVLMAGRAAESLIFQHFSTGAADDLIKATHLARDMVTKYGMEQSLGHVTYDDGHSTFLGTSSNFHQNLYSNETAREIDEAIKNVIWHAYHEAFIYLKEHRLKLELASEELIEKETLSEEELDLIFNTIETKEADSTGHTAEA